MTDPCERHGRVRCDECREVEELKEVAREMWARGDLQNLVQCRKDLERWPWLAQEDTNAST